MWLARKLSNKLTTPLASEVLAFPPLPCQATAMAASHRPGPKVAILRSLWRDSSSADAIRSFLHPVTATCPW